MSEDVPDPPKSAPLMSAYSGPVGELIGRRVLAPPPRPGVLATLEQFEILRILGSGGMGFVLLARDPAAARDVAIKLVRPELAADGQIVRRFLKEAGHLQKLRHPNIVPVLHVCESAQGAYFVMPYFEGGNLSKAIRPGGALERETVLTIGRQVAAGLQFAHRRGIIHRDLKPANILLGGAAGACVADFGLARTIFNDSIVDVEEQQCEGTAPYMSPAVAAGHAEDTRCDIYAFGALLYEMLTGEPPYTGRSSRDIRLRILQEPPRPILTVNPQADRRMAAIAEGAMGRELRDRYADMADVLADLQRAEHEKPPLGPHGVTRKAWSNFKGATRRPQLRWAAVIAALVLGLAWAGWRFRESAAAPAEPPGAAAAPPAAEPAPVSVLFPGGLGLDATGNIYVADRDRSVISRITPRGLSAPLAGEPGMPGQANGLGAAARFSILRGLAVGPQGDIFVTDSYTVRKVSPAGQVTPVAGLAGFPGGEDGASARFRLPAGLAVDRGGAIYVADAYTIRRIAPGGGVSTLAGFDGHAGSDDGMGAAARFSDQAKALAVDRAGNVLVADALNCTIRRITPAGLVTTVAGSARMPGYRDGVGENAQFFRPGGVAVDEDGVIYVADTSNHTIRKITPAGRVTTLAGSAGLAGDQDGLGTSARFDLPLGVALDREGNLYVADSGNHAIRIVRRDGRVTTLRQAAGAGAP